VVVGVDGFRVQVDPLLIDGSLEPFLEGDAIFYGMTNVPVIRAIEGIINHVNLVRPSRIWQV
jgi:hypothetical protein